MATCHHLGGSQRLGAWPPSRPQHTRPTAARAEGSEGPKVWVGHGDFLPKGTAWEGGRRDFMVETPDQHDLSQRNKVNISSDEAC